MLANWAMFRQTPDGQQWQKVINAFDNVHAKVADMLGSWRTVFTAAHEDCSSRVLFKGATMGLFVPEDHPIYTEGKGLRVRAILTMPSVSADQPLRTVFDKAQKDLTKRNPQWAEMNAAWAKWVSETSIKEIGVDFVNHPRENMAPFCEGGFTAIRTFDKEWKASKARIMRELPPYDLDQYLGLSALPKPLPAETYTHPALVKWLTEANEKW
ncbi:hypothetical protein [Rhodococcus sp. RDE2]|uniref:hypothetical protein n=1 Tax=Rhodococcus sp. RDE2 TaxID=2885078 RepID=UPI001E2D28BA|nr:hypothetical protein [Rhodococcus sp. RDE2]BDB63267.1 hypothetical protein RDE2_50610 [Rhodococcus sp. RDE2]